MRQSPLCHSALRCSPIVARAQLVSIRVPVHGRCPKHYYYYYYCAPPAAQRPSHAKGPCRWQHTARSSSSDDVSSSYMLRPVLGPEQLEQEAQCRLMILSSDSGGCNCHTLSMCATVRGMYFQGWQRP